MKNYLERILQALQGFNKCSPLRICEGYFLGNVSVAVQDTPELSSGTMHSPSVFSLE